MQATTRHGASAPPTATVRPVLAALPRELPRRARVERYARLGRRALERAAAAAGAPPLAFARDPDGAPEVEDGWRWSLSNAEGLVAAVVAAEPVGIDVEPVDRPRRETLLAYLAERDPAGLARLGGDGEAALVLWTAFEAALKLLGRGVAGLPATRLAPERPDLSPGWREVAVGALRIPVWSGPRAGHVLSLALRPAAGTLPAIAPLELDDEGVLPGDGA